MARFEGHWETGINHEECKGNWEKAEDLQTELLKRKTDIAIITEKKEEKQRIRRHEQLCNDLLWGTSQTMGIIWSKNCN